MIFMCVINSVKPSFLDRDDDIRQQPPSQFQKQTNCLFCIRVLSENQKEAFRTAKLERTAEATGVIRTTVARIRRGTSERGRSPYPTGAKREPYKYVESFDKAAIRHNTILHCEETVSDSKYSEFNPGWGSVISREHSESRSMHARKNSSTRVLILFKLMRPGWIPSNR